MPQYNVHRTYLPARISLFNIGIMPHCLQLQVYIFGVYICYKCVSSVIVSFMQATNTESEADIKKAKHVY